jgi:hypothetical protein
MNSILEYDASLDNDSELKKQSNFYDKADIEDAFDTSKIETSPPIKRVSINIPKEMYNVANRIAVESGNGYQNVLKMAMFIGLKDLDSKNKPDK